MSLLVKRALIFVHHDTEHLTKGQFELIPYGFSLIQGLRISGTDNHLCLIGYLECTRMVEVSEIRRAYNRQVSLILPASHPPHLVQQYLRDACFDVRFYTTIVPNPPQPHIVVQQHLL